MFYTIFIEFIYVRLYFSIVVFHLLLKRRFKVNNTDVYSFEKFYIVWKALEIEPSKLC